MLTKQGIRVYVFPGSGARSVINTLDCSEPELVSLGPLREEAVHPLLPRW